MTLLDIIKSINKLEGNIYRYKNIYITPENMKKSTDYLAETFINCEDCDEILLSPYLINFEISGGTLELLPHGFTIEICDTGQSYFEGENVPLVFPKKDSGRVPPKATIVRDDKTFLKNALQAYLENGKTILSDFLSVQDANNKIPL